MANNIHIDRIEAAVAEILFAIGENPEREGLQQTPRRVAQACQELFSGIGQDPKSLLTDTFEAVSDDMVILSDIEVRSMCEHHLLPFTGKAHVAYIPDGRIVGFGRIPQVIEVLAARPQLQEGLTADISLALNDALTPKGVMVILECKHMCVSARGQRKSDAVAVTMVATGELDSVAARAEVLTLIRGEQ